MNRNRNRKETQWQQEHPKAGGHYSPRFLYRGMKAKYSSAPGRARIHPKPARPEKEQ